MYDWHLWWFCSDIFYARNDEIQLDVKKHEIQLDVKKHLANKYIQSRQFDQIGYNVFSYIFKLIVF